MKRFTLFASLCLAAGGSLVAQNVSVKAKNRPAATVFAEIMRQTDKNFIYSSSLLKGVKVIITAKNEPLPTVLDRMFDGTGITSRIRGNKPCRRRNIVQIDRLNRSVHIAYRER